MGQALALAVLGLLLSFSRAPQGLLGEESFRVWRAQPGLSEIHARGWGRREVGTRARGGLHN